MALFKRPDRSHLRPAPPPPPELKPGDRVRLKTTGVRGTVVRTKGRSAVVELDEAFSVAGMAQRIYYSYPGELEAIPAVGRMGADALYAEEEGDLPE